jgi:hypothetical protein
MSSQPHKYESDNANTLSSEDSEASSPTPEVLSAQFLANDIEDIRKHTIAHPPDGTQDIDLTHSLDLLVRDFPTTSMDALRANSPSHAAIQRYIARKEPALQDANARKARRKLPNRLTVTHTSNVSYEPVIPDPPYEPVIKKRSRDQPATSKAPPVQTANPVVWDSDDELPTPKRYRVLEDEDPDEDLPDKDPSTPKVRTDSPEPTSFPPRPPRNDDDPERHRHAPPPPHPPIRSPEHPPP